MPGWRQILQRLDDHRWELPVTYKDGMRVPARIYASGGPPGHRRAGTRHRPSRQRRLPARHRMALPRHAGHPLGLRLPPSAAWPLCASTMASSPPAASASTSTAALASSPPPSARLTSAPTCSRCSTSSSVTSPPGSAARASSPSAPTTSTRSWCAAPPGWSSVATAAPRTWRPPRAAASSRTPTPPKSALAPASAATSNSAPSAPATTSWRSRCWSGSSSRLPPAPSASPSPARSSSSSTPGSRGFGHQVCQDFLELMERASHRYAISLPDRQLACAPLASPEGRDYLAAMACAANFAWANRQRITHLVRRAFARHLDRSEEALGLQVPLRTSPTTSPRSSATAATAARSTSASTAKAPPAPSPPATRTSPRATARWASPVPRPRRHEPLLLHRHRAARRHGGDLGLLLPRRRPPAEPARRQAHAARRGPGQTLGGAGHHRPLPQPLRPGGGGQRGLQGRRRRHRGAGARRPRPRRCPACAPSA